MICPARRAILLILLSLAGCATPPGDFSDRAPSWSSGELVPVPPANTPSVSRPTAPEPLPAGVPLVTASRQAVNSTPTWIDLNLWSRSNHLGTMTHSVIAGSHVFSLDGPNGTVTIKAGSHIARWNAVDMHLGYAPQLSAKEPLVHSLDLHKTIAPLLSGQNGLACKTPAIIAIDPGHGGADSGAKSILGPYYEKEYTLDWAKRLQALLSAAGVEAFLTRTSDKELALTNRVAIADEHNATLFISLHFNSAGASQPQSGVETYCLTPAGLPSNLTRGYLDDTSACFPNNAYDLENLDLACRVHRALLKVNGNRDRGIRRARFLTVLRGQQRPAILVEGGYLSNPDEARHIASPAYRQQLAEAVARAVAGRVELASAPASKPATEPGQDSPSALKPRIGVGNATANSQPAAPPDSSTLNP